MSLCSVSVSQHVEMSYVGLGACLQDSLVADYGR